MPQPQLPLDSAVADIKDLLLSLTDISKEQHSAAETRHNEILTKLLEQNQAFKEQLSEIRDVPKQSELSTKFAEIQELLTDIRCSSKALPLTPRIQPKLEIFGNALDAPAQPKDKDTLKESTEAEAAGPQPEPEAAEEPEPEQSAKHKKEQRGSLKKMLSPSSRKMLKHSESNEEETQKRSCMSLVSKVVMHDGFEALIGSFIMANAFVLCFEVQFTGLQVCYELQFKGCRDEANKVWPLGEVTFLFFDWCFGVLFCTEAVFKLLVYKLQYFNDAWNWLDLGCVFAFGLDKVAAAFLPIDGKALRLLRLARLMRLVKLMRSMESLDVLYVMSAAVRGMGKVLFWAVALLSIMLMTVALFLTQILHASYFESSSNASSTMSVVDWEQKKVLFEYFGTFTRCLLSMFELTLANWPPVTRLLAEEVSEWFMLLCVIHKLTIGFAVLGVINGVILQETFKVAATDDMIMIRQKKRNSEMLAKKMLTLFEALDYSGDGLLDFEEFQIIALIPEVKTWLASMDVETDDLLTLFSLIDVNGDGTISPVELARRMPRIKGASRSIDVLAMNRMLVDATGGANRRRPSTPSPNLETHSVSNADRSSAVNKILHK